MSILELAAKAARDGHRELASEVRVLYDRLTIAERELVKKTAQVNKLRQENYFLTKQIKGELD